MTSARTVVPRLVRISRGLAAAALCVSLAAFAQEPRKVNFAVVDIKAGEGVNKGETDIIGDRLRTELFRTGRISMMERDQMQEILKEQGFQHTGACTDDACMVQIGQLLGVERMVSGSIGKLGSMFLVNFRTIEVQTGKLTKVVSLDIKGGIEDVVVELPKIALQLTDSPDATKITAVTSATDSTITTTTSTTVSVPVKADTTPAAAPAEPKKAEARMVDGEREDRNSNRSGLKLSFSIFPGMVEHGAEIYRSENGSVVQSGSSDDIYPFYEQDRSRFFYPQLKFAIRLGRFFTVDFGPGLMFGREVYTEPVTFGEPAVSTYRYAIPSFTLGPSFVWRLAPLKLNVGAFVDFCVPIASSTFETGSDIEESEPVFAVGYNTAFGFRGGAELLVSPHFGLGAEFQFRHAQFDLEFTQSGSDYDASTYSWTDWEMVSTETIKLPSVGICLTANIYY